jgi:hypothetical protein
MFGFYYLDQVKIAMSLARSLGWGCETTGDGDWLRFAPCRISEEKKASLMRAARHR